MTKSSGIFSGIRKSCHDQGARSNDQADVAGFRVFRQRAVRLPRPLLQQPLQAITTGREAR
jgi:hypothetical protein